MPVRHLGCIPILLALSLSTAGAAEQCRLARYPAIPVTMLDRRPTVAAEINGFKTRLLVETGAYVDTLSPAEATEFKLPLTWAPHNYYISGGLGNLRPKVAIVKSFTIGTLALHNAYFLVGANDLGDGIAGVLGQNLYEVRDVEFDFAHGVMRLIKATNCGLKQSLAYWAADTGEPVSKIDLWQRTDFNPQLYGAVEINGHSIKAMFDTGATNSLLSLDAARSAGISPRNAGAVAVGTSGRLWSIPIAEMRLGDNETVEHTRIFVEEGLSDPMIIGADFFLSHHVYLATSQSRLYFTYNGGPVFDLNPGHARPDQARAAPAIAALTPAPSQATQPKSAATLDTGAPAPTPTDAAALMRQGLAYVDRAQFPQALADLTQACQLAPGDADCRYQRGIVYWRSHQPDLALRDFDAALQLDPDDFQARQWRAEVRLWPNVARTPHPKVQDLEPDAKTAAEAKADLDTADRLAPAEADLRLALGRDYEYIGQHAQATHQYNLWITYHPADSRLATALIQRCGSQARGNTNLDQALKDCNAAYRLIDPPWWSADRKWPAWAAAPLLSNRSLIELRQGNLRGAIADDDAAIRFRPDAPYALYARGLAELREGSKAQGLADFAAAEKLDGDIAQRFTSMGLAP